MKSKFSLFIIKGLLLLAALTTSLKAQVMMVSSQVSTPLHVSYAQSMDMAYGLGKWQQHYFEKTNLDSLLASNVSYIYIEGVDDHIYYAEDFIKTKGAQLEKWVQQGHILYINVSPQYSRGINLGFGGVSSSDASFADTVEIADIDHPIFKGPKKPLSEIFWGHESHHAAKTILQGQNLKPIIRSKTNPTELILAEKVWGAGKVIFGTLNSTRYVLPQTELLNLRSNILNIKKEFQPIDVRLEQNVDKSSKPKGLQAITVKLANYGTTRLTAATLNWSIDGQLQAPFIWTEGLDAFQDRQISTDSFSIGSFVFEKSHKYELKVWLSALNGSVTPASQDTLKHLISTSLEGAYVVGGEQWDFETLEEAVSSLIEVGITGPTVFNLAPGSHPLNINLPLISGASATNTITFQSLSGDSATTGIYHSEYGSYVLGLKGAAHMIFKNLSINHSFYTYDYGYAVYLQEGTHDILFTNCHITGSYYNSSTSDASAIYLLNVENNPCYNISFKNNAIFNGSHGIYASQTYNQETNVIRGLTIEGNEFNNQYAGGIRLNNATEVQIHRNIISGTKITNYSGIYLEQVQAFSITRNRLYAHILGNGIVINNSIALHGKPSSIYNNSFFGDGHANVMGLSIVNSEGISVYHNTFNITNTYIGSTALQVQGSTQNLYLYNNNFCMRGNGPAGIFTVTSLQQLVSDYNNFYTAGTYTFHVNGKTLKNLEDWTTTSLKDSHSVAVDAGFLDEDGYKATKGLLDGTGKALAEVSHDLKGAVRDLNHPDIGADEFVASGLDLTLQSLLLPQAPFAPGSHTFGIKVSNGGAQTITSFKVTYRFTDAAASVYQWTGILEKGKTINVNISTLTFLPLQPHAISVEVSDLNGDIDLNPIDNTLERANMYTALPGTTYTIGGTDPDFVSFLEVQNLLNHGGILGNVTFRVRDGLYNEHIHLKQIAGSGSSGQIIFQSQSGDSSKVVMTYFVKNYEEDSNYVVKLENTSYITFKNMSFQPNGTYYARAVFIDGTCSNILFANNAFIGKELPDSYSSYYLIQAEGSVDVSGDIVFENNLLLNNSHGFVLNAKATSASGKIVIKRNVLENQTSAGFQLSGQAYTQIISNSITTTFANTNYRAISISASKEGIQILKNRITNNGGYGIYLYDLKSTADQKLLVANNWVSTGGTSTSIPLYVNNLVHANIYYNTFKVSSNKTNAYGTAVISTIDEVGLYNNHFIHNSAGYPLYFENNQDFLKIKSDYNNYFNTGTNLIYSYNGSKSYFNVSQWNSYTGQDSHSSSIDPMFEVNSYRVTNYHLNGTATPTPLVTDDIDNIARASAPDIGAGEFSPQGLNLTLRSLPFTEQTLTAGEHPISIVVQNNGSVAINKFKVSWQVNATAQQEFQWTGSLLPNTADTLSIGTFNFQNGKLYSFVVSLKEPNETGIETDNSDNSLTASNQGVALKGTYTIGGTNPDFKNFSEAALLLNKKGIAGNVIFKIRPGTYNEQVVLKKIPGASTLQSVVFQSENRDSNTVILSYFAEKSTANYTLLMDSTQYVSFKGITLKSENESYPVVVYLTNGCTNNTFTSNKIIAIASGRSGYAAVRMYSESAGLPNHHNLFKNNSIENGYYGIQISTYGSSTATKEAYNDIINNTFKTQEYVAIDLSDQYFATIEDNTIEMLGDRGISLSITIGVKVSGNKIFLQKGGTGIYVASIQNPDTVTTIVSNNFVKISSTDKDDAQSISVVYCQNVALYFNTLILNTPFSLSRNLELESCKNIKVYNNLILTHNKGFAMSLYNTTNLQSDYNNFFSQSNTPFKVDNTVLETAAWSSLNGQDAHSQHIDPVFNGAKAWQSSDPRLRHKGLKISGIDTDIDGEPRADAPDLGADENTLSNSSDLGLLSFTSPLPPVASGNHPVKVVLFNNSTITINTAQLLWSINDTLKGAVQWTGNLLAAERTEVTLGNFILPQGKNAGIKVWLSNLGDHNLHNDTLVLNNLRAGMKGTYTIGKQNADFPNFNAAVNALKSEGSAGHITFLVKADTYNEQWSVPKIFGTSDTSTITFKPQSGESILTYASSDYTSNYIVQLKGTDHITLSGFRFVPLSNSYGTCLNLADQAEYNQIQGNLFEGIKNETSENTAIIKLTASSSEFTNNYNLIENNRFNNGGYGIMAYGYGNNSIHNIFKKNILENQNHTAIYLSGQNSSQIISNKITTNTTNSFYHAINSSNSTGALLIDKNKITVANGTAAILCSYHKGTSAQRGTIANNFCTVKGANNVSGIEIYSCEYIGVYFNSVLNKSTGLKANAFKSSTCKYHRVVNNIFANKGTGYAASFDDLSYLAFADRNNYFALGTQTFSSTPTLASWRVNYGIDFNSLSLDPLFESDTVLRTSEVSFNTQGQPIPGITEDIDGERRSSSRPSIGADENVPDDNDAGIHQIVAPVKPFVSGERTVEVLLRNYGGAALQTAVLHWSINGVMQADVSWSGNLELSDTALVTLGRYDFVPKTGYTLKIWTSNPNGMADHNSVNDTIRTEPLYPALKGSYTIGGLSPNFSSINEAVSALTNGGIVDSVQFNLRKGNYNERIVIPAIKGASQRNDVVFQAESGLKTDVEIVANGAVDKNYVILLDAADYISFKNLTLNNTSSTYGVVLSLYNGSDYISVDNVAFSGQAGSTLSQEQALILVKPLDFNNNFLHVKSCSFNKGTYGLYTNGMSNSSQKGLVVHGNDFKDAYAQEINALYQEAPTITNNQIFSSSIEKTHSGIKVSSSVNKINIANNKINLSSGGSGIELYDINNAFTSVANNFISVAGSLMTRGIAIYYSNYIGMYHNSIVVNNKNLSADNCAITLSGNNHGIFNNNIYIANTGYSIYYKDGTFSSNYNNLYSKGPQLAYYKKPLKNLEEWRLATGYDNASLSVDPHFKGSQDLCTSNALLNDVAPMVQGITTDISGTIRKNSTDIGACEFTPSGLDAAVIALTNPSVPILSGVQEVKVVLYNNGSEPLNSVSIDWSVNGVLQTQNQWSGTLPAQGKLTINLGSYDFQQLQSYQLKAWTSVPNASADDYIFNDTLNIQQLSPALKGIYTVGGQGANYANFSQAVEALHRHGVAGKVEFSVNDGIYNEQLLLEKIQGVSAQNTITFTSASGDSTKTTLSFAAPSESNYLIWLRSSNYITFKNMTLEALDKNYAQILKLSDGSSYINITSCILAGKNGNTWGGQTIISNTENTTGNRFAYNVFTAGSYGINLTGTSATLQNNEIIGNVFYSQLRAAIYLSYQSRSLIQNNRIMPQIHENDYAAISVSNSQNGISVSGNQLVLPGTSRSKGIYLNANTGSSTAPVLVYNNFVNFSKSDESTGIDIMYCNNVGIYHNTVRMAGQGTLVREAFKLQGGNTIDLKNNIFTHFGNGRAVSISESPSITSDHNDFFTTGTIVALWQNTSYTTLEALQTATNKDQHSLSIDPVFVGAFDLHVTQPNLDGTAAPITWVKEDVDGHTRHVQTPDIGADEFGSGLITKDIGITSILAPLSNCDLNGDQFLVVKLQNFGVDTLSDISIHYVLNDTLLITEKLTGIRLKGGQAYNYKFKTPIHMATHGLYSFDVFTSLDMDSNKDNDTISNHLIHHYPLSYADAGRDTTICQSASYTLMAKGGATYTWHVKGSETVYANQSNQPISLDRKTTFVLKSYNTYGCVATDTVTINVVPKPETPVITQKGELGNTCTPESVVLTSNIKSHIIWYNNDTTASITVRYAGYYELSHYDPISSCVSKTSYEVKSKPRPQAIASSTLICPGEQVSLSVINGGHSFMWSTGETSATIFVKPSSTTTYTVKFKSNDGCDLDMSLTVSVRAGALIPSIASVTGDSAVCAGSNALLTVKGKATSFSWSNGMSGASIMVNPTQKTIYTVTAHGGTCSNQVATATIVVDILPGPEKAPIIVATGSSTLSFCETDAITLNSSDYAESIRWSTGDTTPSITVVTQGIYTLSHVSKYGCSKSSTVKIEDPSVPYITGKTTLCKGEATTLTVINGHQYTWSTGERTDAITVSPDTTTEYTVIIKNRQGCTYEQKIKVSTYETPVVTGISADTAICQGDSLTLVVNGKAKEFLWTDGHIGNTIKISPKETTIYGVKATNGCATQAANDYLNVKVTVLPLPEIPIIKQGTHQVFCQGNSLLLESSISDSILWSTGATVPQITVRDTGTVQLYHINRYACSSTAEIKIAYPPKAYIAIGGQGFKTICKGDQAILSLVNGDTYTWSNGANTESINVSPIANTTYKVSGTNAYGCSYKDSISIKVIEPLPPAMVKNMLPLNNVADLTLPLNLSWNPSENASHYDLRIWEETNSVPEQAFVSNTEQIMYRVEHGLEFGKKYNWQVTAKNSCTQTTGGIQQLELRKIPDFEVKNILVPASAFSGQEVLVSWEVRNVGLGKSLTKEYWFDKIYLSSDSIFNSRSSTYLTGVSNKTALDTGQSYISSALIRLPEGISGPYYVHVACNGNWDIKENNMENNVAHNQRYMLIHLTPPPDLQVTEVKTLSNVFSGQTLNLSWTVTNKGEGKTQTNAWKDQIYLSQDSILRTATAVMLGTIDHTGALDPNKFYTDIVPVILPHGIFGEYYIHVVTDTEDKVFEHAYNNNNSGKSNAIAVTLLPPSDLIPLITVIPAAASNKDKIQIQWTVKNQGGSMTNVSRWTDEIYMSNSLVFDPRKALLIGSKTHYGSLNLGESYAATAQVTIPDNVNGANYIFIVTDRLNEVFEHENKGNNTARSFNILRISSPDLVIESMVTSNTAINSGEQLTVKWLLKNNGTGIVPISATWEDSLFVKPSVSSDTVRAKSFAAAKVTTSRALKPGDTLSVKATIFIPEGISGTWYLLAKANASKTVYEAPEGVANNTFSKSIAVTLSPWADLKISSLTSPQNRVEAGLTFPLHVNIKNEGKVATKDSIWIDHVYLSSSPILSKDTLLLTGARTSFILAKDSSYGYDIDVPIPIMTEQGNYYLHVLTDATSSIYEHSGEANNWAVMGPISVTYGQGPDLVAAQLTAPDTVLSGLPYSLSWNVINQGKLETYDLWDDAIYLSKDTIWQPQADHYLAAVSMRSNLDTGMTYLSTLKPTVPEAISGKYYWIVVADYNPKTPTLSKAGDRNRSNNYTIRPVYIDMNTVPDLAVGNVQAPEEGISGQPITLQYTVTNQGTSKTRPQKWTDRIYLSTDFKVDAKDLLLSSTVWNDSLTVGAYYTQNQRVTLPLANSGNYILLIQTDAGNTQYEDTLEANNIAASAIHIEMPLPADLLVTELHTTKTQYMAGEDLKIVWTLFNKGINGFSGIQEEQFYLSKNKTWDLEDVYLGSHSSFVNLAPNGSNTLERSLPINNASVGTYYIIARTDARNLIPETDETNNETASSSAILIDVKELILNTPTADSLQHTGSVCYKIVIPDSLNHETLLVELFGEGQYNRNELYIRYGEAPTRNKYDAAFGKPFSGSQEALISEMKPGTYYVLVYGENQLSNKQYISLKASILHFEIRSVKTNVGGNTGSVTTCIQGAKFKPSSVFYLYRNNQALKASKIYYINPTKVYATFDLIGAELGYYDVVAEDTVQGTESLLMSAFKVEKGTLPLLELDLHYVKSLRAGQTMSVQALFANGGNIDMPTPTRAVVCTSHKIPLGMSLEDLKYFLTSLHIRFEEPEGPQGVLRPGAIGEKTFYLAAYVTAPAHIHLKILSR